MPSHRTVAALLCAAILAGCAPSTAVIMGSDQSAVQLRSYQQRAFDTADKTQTLRSVISTLQDLSFVVDKADLDLGTVSATKLSGYQLRMTVTARPRGTNQMLVRANAQYMDKAQVAGTRKGAAAGNGGQLVKASCGCYFFTSEP